MISKALWEKNSPPLNPFMKFEFMNALIESGSVGLKSGWDEAIIATDDGILLNFIKHHSFGEYIFDWGWAEAYERYRIPYYPKLTSMIPFTPVTTKHFLMKEFDMEKAAKLLRTFDDVYARGPWSGAHFLFLDEKEIPLFKDYHLRESIQYHFSNTGFRDFEDYLSVMKTKKRKNIQNERMFSPELKITQYTKETLQKDHGKRMYEFYISTIQNKNSFDYLNENFFVRIFESMKDNILYVEAELEGTPVAGSLFFYDSEKLFGRYWGADRFIENLHFELCYYQGIDFVIANKLKTFEAGAQGEHKIARGFRPVRVYSAHKLKHEGFHEAIGQFIDAEKIKINYQIEELSKLLPYA